MVTSIKSILSASDMDILLKPSVVDMAAIKFFSELKCACMKPNGLKCNNVAIATKLSKLFCKQHQKCKFIDLYYAIDKHGYDEVANFKTMTNMPSINLGDFSADAPKPKIKFTPKTKITFSKFLKESHKKLLKTLVDAPKKGLIVKKLSKKPRLTGANRKIISGVTRSQIAVIYYLMAKHKNDCAPVDDSSYNLFDNLKNKNQSYDNLFWSSWTSSPGNRNIDNGEKIIR